MHVLCILAHIFFCPFFFSSLIAQRLGLAIKRLGYWLGSTHIKLLPTQLYVVVVRYGSRCEAMSSHCRLYGHCAVRTFSRSFIEE